MSSTVQRICGWSGIAWVTVFTLGFWVIAGFIPPPSPNSSAAVIAAFYEANRASIRVGLILSAVVSGLFTVFSAGISMQLRRIEGRYAGLANMQLALGTLVVLELLFPMMFWLVATFRAERSPESVQLINDLGWMPFVGITSTVLLQALSIAAGILWDRSEDPVFPRWLGYFNIWAGLLFTPGSVIAFFKTGPLAWDGVFSLYIPIAAFGIWILVMSHQLIKTAPTLDVGAGDRTAPAGV